MPVSSAQSLGDRRLVDVISAVSGAQPTPAAGSAAAVTVALAAGLVAKCARKAAGRVEGSEEMLRRAEELAARAAELADADAACYAEVLGGLRAQRARPEDPAARDALQERLSQAADPPLAIAEVGAEIAAAAAELAARGKPWLRGDAHAAALLAESATQSAAALVQLNLRWAGGSDDRRERARWLSSAAGESRSRAEAALDLRSHR